MRKVGLLALLTVFAVSGISATERHLALDRAEPGADSTVEEAPETITLYFTQVPDLAGTTIRLIAADESQVEMSDTRFHEEDHKIVMADVEGELAHGAYKVVWRAMSPDGHPVNGDFAFTYATTEESTRLP